MPTRKLTTAQMVEALTVFERVGNVAHAALELGIARPTMQHRLKLARDMTEKPRIRVKAGSDTRRAALRGHVGGPPIPPIAIPPEGFIVHQNSGSYDAEGNLLRQWVGSRRDAGDPFAVPAGHVVKGESALVDPDGRVLARWIKTREGAGEGLIEGLRAAFAEYSGAAPVIPAPVVANADLLTVYPLPDLHIGMLAWGMETGEDYDLRIATEMAMESLSMLVDQSLPSAHAVILGLGDWFHQDDQKNTTPGSGHALDVDGRWAKVFATGAKLATAMVDMVARKHASVEARFLSGNHDISSSMCLTVALSLFYSGNERITVNTDPGIAWYRRFGNCLLGATHGHTVKMDRVAMMMAADRPQDWGQSAHRSFFTGHIHSETSRECAGVRVESLQALTARDAWNAAAGYRSGRSVSAITFHREHGETARHRINLPSRKAA